MSLRFLLIPAALVVALALAGADTALAAPLGAGSHAQAAVTFGPRIHVGARIGIPVGFQGGHYREVVRYQPGYYETRTREVQVPGELIGYGRRGRPIYSEPRIEIETYRVWIPGRRVVERVWVPNRRPLFLHRGHRGHPRHGYHRPYRTPRGRIEIGAGIRLR